MNDNNLSPQIYYLLNTFFPFHSTVEVFDEHASSQAVTVPNWTLCNLALDNFFQFYPSATKVHAGYFFHNDCGIESSLPPHHPLLLNIKQLVMHEISALSLALLVRCNALEELSLEVNNPPIVLEDDSEVYGEEGHQLCASILKYNKQITTLKTHYPLDILTHTSEEFEKLLQRIQHLHLQDNKYYNDKGFDSSAFAPLAVATQLKSFTVEISRDHESDSTSWDAQLIPLFLLEDINGKALVFPQLTSFAVLFYQYEDMDTPPLFVAAILKFLQRHSSTLEKVEMNEDWRDSAIDIISTLFGPVNLPRLSSFQLYFFDVKHLFNAVDEIFGSIDGSHNNGNSDRSRRSSNSSPPTYHPSVTSIVFKLRFSPPPDTLFEWIPVLLWLRFPQLQSFKILSRWDPSPVFEWTRSSIW